MSKFIYKIYNPRLKEYMTAQDCGGGYSNKKKFWLNKGGARYFVNEYKNPRCGALHGEFQDRSLEIHKFEVSEHFVEIVVDLPKIKC